MNLSLNSTARQLMLAPRISAPLFFFFLNLFNCEITAKSGQGPMCCLLWCGFVFLCLISWLCGALRRLAKWPTS